LKRRPERRGKPGARKKRGAQDSRLSRRLALSCADAADSKLGEQTVILDVRRLTFVTDFVVITTAGSPPHAKAIAQEIEQALVSSGGLLHHREGDHNSPWLLLDCHEVIVHIFSAQARDNYDLEHLWADAPRLKFDPGAPKSRSG
jgi:ribosome-associated protein